jgi:hypothetical protein
LDLLKLIRAVVAQFDPDSIESKIAAVDARVEYAISVRIDEHDAT